MKKAPLPCVLFLNGFPGVGKLSIGLLLEKVLPESRLIDNHLLIDPVEAIEPDRKTTAHYELRLYFRRIAFDRLKKIESKHLTVMMTSCSAATPDDIRDFAEHVDIARVRRVPFLAVNLICEESVNAMRLCSDERVNGHRSGTGKSKLIDANVLSELHRDFTLLDPRQYPTETMGVEVQFLEINTTHLSIEDAAQKVLEFLRDKASISSI